MTEFDLEAIRARDADDYAAADVLRNIRSAGNTDPELEATINMIADRRALLAAYDALAARLAEAEHLILRMAGEDYQRARFYVEKYDLTGERAAVSATVCLHQIHNGDTCEICGAKVTPVVQPERCCVDYPRCDCNSPPEPDNAPTLQPCGHPWKAQHNFKCILCSSPG